MPLIKSLGPHHPAGLHVLVAEKHLPPNPPHDAYSWRIYQDPAGVEEEIVAAPQCVVWSQGGTVRRVFRFASDHVSHALLTHFPPHALPRPAQSSDSARDSDLDSRRYRAEGHPQDRALIVILKHELHIYFLHGSSHVLALPFEVERAFPLAYGVLLQRKQAAAQHAAPTPILPSAPPNSFLSSQHTAWPSSHPGRTAPEQTKRSTGRESISTNPWPMFGDLATPQDAMPHLFVVSRPVSELGLVVEASDFPPTRSAIDGLEPINQQDDILHVSSSPWTPPDGVSRPLTVVISVNKATQKYTIWYTINVETDTSSVQHSSLKKRRQSLRRSTRRSSYNTRLSTGTATPTVRQTDTFNDELGLRKSQSSLSMPHPQTSRLSDSFILDEAEDELAPKTQSEYLARGSGNMSTRRTSSMVARAELSSQDLGDMARNPPAPGASFGPFGKPRQSFGAFNDRASFGRTRVSGRASTPGSVSLLSDVEEAPSTDDGIDDHRMIDPSSIRSVHSSKPHMGLSKELTLVRACSIPFGDISQPNALPAPSPGAHFVLEPPRICDLEQRQSIPVNLFLMHTASKKILQIHLSARLHRSEHPSYAAMKHSSGRATRNTVVLNRRYHVFTFEQRFQDIALVTDHGFHSVLGIQANITNPLVVPLYHPLQGYSKGDPSAYVPFEKLSPIELLDPPKKPKKPTRHGPKADAGPKASESETAVDFTSLASPVHHMSSRGRFTICARSGQLQRYQFALAARNPKVRKVLTVMDHALGEADSSVFSDFWLRLRYMQSSGGSENEAGALYISLFYVFLHLLSMAANIAAPPLGSVLLSSPVPRQEKTNRGLLLALDTDAEFVSACFQAALLNASTIIHDAPEIKTSVEQSLAWTSAESLRRFMAYLHFMWAEDQMNTAPDDVAPLALGPILSHIAFALSLDFWRGYTPSEDLNGRIPMPQALLVRLKRSSVLYEIGNTLKDLLNVCGYACANPAPSASSTQLSEIHDQLTKLCTCLVKTNATQLRNLEAAFAVAVQLQKLNGHARVKLDVFDQSLSGAQLDSMPETVSWPSREYGQKVRESPRYMGDALKLKALGREDLMLLHQQTLGRAEPELLSLPLRTREALTMEEICEFDENAQSLSIPRLEETTSLLRHIFRDDKRWHEASKLVDPLRVAVTTIHPGEGMTEAAFLDALKDRAQLVYQRTMALPSGQAVMRFSTHRPVLTEKVKISTFNTTCSMQPSNNSVNADKSNFTEEKVGWAFFHAGVNAGLQISRDATGIDTSWLVLNKPTELGNRHAGLLLALGLNGHLKKMAKWLAFKYLTAKHTMTSVGLLIGLAASSLGTMDSLITRLLSVHVSRLLPPGAAELNLSPLTQTAGIMSVGLLYYNSQHRRMSEVMLSEIEHIDLEDNYGGVQEAFRDEGYRLAAAFSLGLINLAKGKDLRAVHDLRVVERLLAVATGPREISTVHVLDQSAAGATIAIAMIFMKTQDRSIAREINIPSTVHQYDSVRPDILLLRTMAHWLILWDDIHPSVDWVRTHSPKEWRHVHSAAGLNHNVLDSTTIPFYNIVAGLCWAIALRHAGSSSGPALEVLHHYFRIVSSILSISGYSNTFDRSLTRDTLLRWQHVLALSMATVCAGTGNLEVLRVLRSMHGDVTNKTFGFHQATHMAIGLLFMGQGRYTFGTSDLSIAAMLMSFYPVFPKDILDNRAHLQALRHFWVFAAEPRCLVPRDVETHEASVVPIRIVLRQDSSGEEETEITKYAPCLLPELSKIRQVHVVDPEYHAVTLDFENKPQHLKAFERHQTLFLKRKPLDLQQPHMFGASLAVSTTRNQDFEGRRGTRTSLEQTNEWIFGLPAFDALSVNGDTAEVLPRRKRADKRAVKTDPAAEVNVRSLLDMGTTAVDDLLVLGADTESNDRAKLMGLRFVLGDGTALAEEIGRTGSSAKWFRDEWIEALRARIVARARAAAPGPPQGTLGAHDSMNIDE